MIVLLYPTCKHLLVSTGYFYSFKSLFLFHGSQIPPPPTSLLLSNHRASLGRGSAIRETVAWHKMATPWPSRCLARICGTVRVPRDVCTAAADLSITSPFISRVRWQADPSEPKVSWARRRTPAAPAVNKEGAQRDHGGGGGGGGEGMEGGRWMEGENTARYGRKKENCWGDGAEDVKESKERERGWWRER